MFWIHSSIVPLSWGKRSVLLASSLPSSLCVHVRGHGHRLWDSCVCSSDSVWEIDSSLFALLVRALLCACGWEFTWADWLKVAVCVLCFPDLATLCYSPSSYQRLSASLNPFSQANSLITGAVIHPPRQSLFCTSPLSFSLHSFSWHLRAMRFPPHRMCKVDVCECVCVCVCVCVCMDVPLVLK